MVVCKGQVTAKVQAYPVGARFAMREWNGMERAEHFNTKLSLETFQAGASSSPGTCRVTVIHARMRHLGLHSLYVKLDVSVVIQV